MRLIFPLLFLAACSAESTKPRYHFWKQPLAGSPQEAAAKRAACRFKRAQLQRVTADCKIENF
jgi:hypothetical protein